jgi:peptide/nickel transport system permease protein
VVRKVLALVLTLVAATALAHVFFAMTLGEERLTTVLADLPSGLVDRFARGDLGETSGVRCVRKDPVDDYRALCSSYTGATIAEMLRTRVPVDVSLLVVGVLGGTLAGVAGGRWCATRPDTRRTQGLRALTAAQLSTPPFFQALVVLFFFSSNVSGFIRLPFLSGQGDYVPLGQDPIQFLKAMWLPWLLVALPLAALVLRLTETTLRETLQEDFMRTAQAKGVSERRSVNRHALPVSAPAVAGTVGVNVGTLLLTVAVLEYAFSIPGMFRVIYSAGMFRDLPVLEGIVIEGVVLIALANLFVDLFQARLDPRVRAHGV